MKYVLTVVTLVLLAIQLPQAQKPQQMKKTFNTENALIIRELGLVIVPKDNSLIVEVVLGNHESEASDIQKDDKVLMANGKKIRSIADLRKQYDELSVGSEFKLGMKRADNLFISSFEKKSEEELNKSGGETMVMSMGGEEGERILPAIGLRFKTKKDRIVITGTLPRLTSIFTSFIPKEGDIIVSLNGKSFSDAVQFDDEYTEMKQGENITLEFSRNGKETKTSFKKPKPMGGMMMKK